MTIPFSNILIEASKYPDLETKNIKKFTKLLKYLYPEASITLNKKGTSKVKFYDFQIIILLNPQSVLSNDEISQFQEYVKNKGNLILFVNHSNSTVLQNLNFLLESFHMSINNDQVIRTSYKKGYYHPKCAFIKEGVLNRSISHHYKLEKNEFHILYPFGHTINCNYPSIPLLGTGMQCYPVNRPVAALYDNSQSKVFVCGCFQLITDKYFDSLENSKFIEYVLLFLKGDLKLDELDVRESGINEYHHVSEINELANQLQYGIEECDTLETDMKKLHVKEVYHLSTKSYSVLRQVYENLQIPLEPLILIPPEFLTPLPTLKMAYFPPVMRTGPSAPLELFDLDEHCASERERLGMTVNKCILF
eukprot:NODE_110_length_18645_cov_0.794403.p6 type:complete len:363 gc:universal NODE_110_length_18645_cov_0.794403:16260-17348(+)